MIKTLIPFRVLRAFIRECALKFIRELNGVLHDIPGIARVYALPGDCQDRARRVKALIAHIAEHTAVHRVGMIRAKAPDIKICHTVPDLLVGREPDADPAVPDLRVCQQMLRHRHDLGDAGLVVTAEQRIAVRHDQALALTFR